MTSTEPPRVYLSLGSNIDPAVNLPEAVARLAERLRVRAVSGVWASAAKGAPGAPPFLNAAVRVETDLLPRALKRDLLRPLEAAMGRVRSGDPNAPRQIDIDLSLYGDLVLEDPAAGQSVHGSSQQRARQTTAVVASARVVHDVVIQTLDLTRRPDAQIRNAVR